MSYPPQVRMPRFVATNAWHSLWFLARYGQRIEVWNNFKSDLQSSKSFKCIKSFITNIINVSKRLWILFHKSDFPLEIGCSKLWIITLCATKFLKQKKSKNTYFENQMWQVDIGIRIIERNNCHCLDSWHICFNGFSNGY